MSIVCESSSGWFIDHKQDIECCYRKVYDNTQSPPTAYKCDESMFDIKSQFVTDSKFNAQKTDMTRDDESKKKREMSKKKKRKAPLNEGEKDGIAFHEKVVEKLKMALEQLIELASQKEALKKKPKSKIPRPTDNNIRAREFALLKGPGDTLVEMCETAKQLNLGEEEPVDLIQSGYTVTESVVNRIVKFCGKEEACTKNIFGSEYVIPANCSFLLSDMTCLHPLLKESRFNVIVMDPPWENKSIKRKKKYYTMSDTSLLQLPICDLKAENCMVIVWVTNKQRQQRFVIEELFPKWKVQYRTHWYWLKVTKYGDPVVPLDSGMKKPYECLIIGTSGSEIINIPENKVIISVPCATHSRKPPLNDLLRELSKPWDLDNPQCLEMFARNLHPGWTSWGNEVLLHQHVDFFSQMEIELKSSSSTSNPDV